ncbi:MAG TPA: ABC transporter substrate-binding protein [Thermofilum sp.]|nr:ABC transporter substrate-binding protein [Thermofilum sp.]
MNLTQGSDNMRVITLVMLFIVVLAGLLPIFNSQPKGPRMGGTLVIAHWGDPLSFNPDAQVDDAGYIIHSMIFNKLVTLDSDYNVIPDLAYKWEVSKDGKVYTFYLYRNVTWHDGTPFTSADVAWTLNAIKEFKGVAYEDIKAENIEKIETPDDYTVVVHLKEPYAPFIQFLAWYGTFILPKHIYENVTDWLSPNFTAIQHPIGTGPFKFVEWVKGDHITLEANENFFRGRPYLDRIVFKVIPDATSALQAFLAGEADLLNHRPPLTEIPRLQATSGVKVLMEPVPSRWYLCYNMRHPPLNDTRVRRAIAHAINRTEIVEKAESGYGFVAEGTYTPAIEWAYNPNVKLPEYDPEKANKILDEAGYERGTDGFRFKLSYVIWQGPEEEAMGQIIKERLKEIGIDVEIKVLEFSLWLEKVYKGDEYDLTVVDGFQGPDPANLRFRVTGEPPVSLNLAHYNNTEVIELFEKGEKIADPELRKEYYWKIQEILAEDLPYLPLVDLMVFHIYKAEFHGFPWEPEARGKVGYNDYRLVWWEGGEPIVGFRARDKGLVTNILSSMREDLCE